MNTQDLHNALVQHFSEVDAARRRLAEEDTIRLTRLQDSRRKFVAYVEKELRPALQATADCLKAQGAPTKLTEQLNPSLETPVCIRLDFAQRPAGEEPAKEAPGYFIEARLVEPAQVRITYTQREGNIHPVRSTDYRQLEAPEDKALQDLIVDCVKCCFPVPAAHK